MPTPAPAFSDHRRPKALVNRITRSRTVAWSALALALAVLAITVIGGTLHLRVHLRDHLAQRDGEVLTAVALARQYANGSGSNLTQRLRNPADQLVLALEISQIKDKEGVLGVRLFDADGGFQTGFPPTLIATNLASSDLPGLRALQPVSRFHEQAQLTDYFLVDVELDLMPANTPLLEVNIPLHARGDSNLVAVAQLLLDGAPIAREYSRVDTHLWLLGLGLYAGGAVLLSGVLFWAYRRLRKAHMLVEEHTVRLLRANHELTLAAKTSALGSVTAHLIHGLSNPLANLQEVIASHAHGANGDGFEILKSSTRRMQQLVEEVVRVLGEERGEERYQITLAELAQSLNRKLTAVVRDSGVRFVTAVEAQGSLANRHANLILLILENLIHNAILVTPSGRTVSVRLVPRDGCVCCEVADEGPGLAQSMLPRLFTPCRSTQGGSGLGLAISKQLANQLGATLELKVNSPNGCVFVLTLPSSVLSETEVSQASKG